MRKENPLTGLMESLVRYREDHGMTQAQFADFIGVHLSTVKRWETGMNGPKTEEIMEIADKMGLTIDELLLGIKPENVDIHRETGLSNEAIESLRHRNSADIFYLESIIEPLLQNNHIAYDLLSIAAIRKSVDEHGEPQYDPDDQYLEAGIKWGIVELFSKLIDEAVSRACATQDPDLDQLLGNRKKISAYKDFANILREIRKTGDS